MSRVAATTCRRPGRSLAWWACCWALLIGPAAGCHHAEQPAAPVVPPLTRAQVIEHLQRIDAARQSGKLSEIAPEYAARQQKSPDDPHAWFLAGRAQEDGNEAFKLYEKALALAPESYWANLGMGESYLRMGILHRALDRLQRTVRLDETLPYAHAALGEVYRQMANAKESIAEFEKAISREGNSLLARKGLAEIYLASGNRKGAREQLQVAAKLAPADFALQLTLGELLLEEKLNAEAAAIYRQATELNANHPGAWYGRASAALAQGLRDEAAIALARVLELKSDHQQARQELAALLVEKGEPAKAEPLYRDVIAADPDNREARRGQAACFTALGRFDDALLVYRELTLLDPQDEQSKTHLAELVKRIGASDQPVTGKTLQAVFDQLLQQILGCHKQLLEKTPKLAGDLVVSVEIGDSGKVDGMQFVSDTTGSPELRACAAWTVRTAVFPAKHAATVTFPIKLQQDKK